jgi:hypothetical protein
VEVLKCTGYTAWLSCCDQWFISRRVIRPDLITGSGGWVDQPPLSPFVHYKEVPIEAMGMCLVSVLTAFLSVGIDLVPILCDLTKLLPSLGVGHSIFKMIGLAMCP